MTGLTTLTSKNQFTLPVRAVRLLGWEPGTRILTRVKEDRLIVEKAGDWSDLAGVLADLPMAKKYTPLQAVKIAQKREAKRIDNEA